MEFRFGFMAESADLSTKGKFNVLGGGIEYVTCKELPWPIALAFVAKIRILPHERNLPATLTIQLVRPNGEMWEVQQELQTRIDDVPLDQDAFHVVILQFTPMVIEQLGVYRIVLTVADTKLGETSFRAVPAGSAGDTPRKAESNIDGNSSPDPQ